MTSLNKAIEHRRIVLVVLIVLVAAAVLLRVPMLLYGMPFDLGDEDENGFIGCALNYGATMSLKPILTWYPAFHTYVLAAAFGVYFLFGLVTGAVSGATDFAVSYLMYPGKFHFVGRLVSMLFTAAGIVLIYHCGKRYQGRLTGLLASGLLALSSMALVRTSWALPDSTYLLLTILSIYFVLCYGDSRRLRHAVAAGLCCGLAVATKYNVGTLLVVGICGIALTHWELTGTMRLPARLMSMLRVRAFYAYGVAVVLGFIIGTPYFVFDIPLHLAGLQWEIGRLGAEASGSSNFFSRLPYLWIFSELVVWERGMGILVIVGLLVSIGRLVRGERIHWMFLPYLLVTVVLIGRYDKHSLHYMFPAFPALFLAAAAGLSRLFQAHRYAAALMAIGVTAALISSTPKLLSLSSFYTQTDTRLAASNWIQSNLPSRAVIAIGRTIHAPPLQDADRFSKPAYSMIGEQIMSRRLPKTIKRAYSEKISGNAYRLTHYIVRQSGGRTASYAEMMSDFAVLPMDRLTAPSPDFVIYSSADRGYLLRGGYSDFLDIPGFNKSLRLEKNFAPTGNGLVGPRIAIYSVQ
ncbi:MAG: ArnT family glycosyltransferase [Desulfobacterales bacterium]